MKKRFFNALLLGAVLLSVNAVTSCKDYDDDINNLQSQIDGLASAEQLKNDIAALNAAVESAKAEALAEAKKALDVAGNAASKEELAAVKAAAEKAQADAAKAQADLDAAKASLEALIANKADQADLDAANEKIALAELAIAENKALAEAALALAGEKTDAASALAAAQAAIDEAKRELEELIDAKADAKTVTDATDRVEALEAFVGAIDEGKTLDDVVSAAVAEALTGTTEDAGLATRVAALEAAVFTKTEAELVNNISLLQEALKALQEDAAALRIAVSEMITSIQLFGTIHEGDTNYWGGIKEENGNSELMSGSWEGGHGINNPCDHTLTFTTIAEQDNEFKAPDGTVLTFNKENYTTYGDSIVVRVTPANAVLTKEMVSLINSQNAVLEDVEVESVEKFNTLLTRAAGNGTGLWTIKFNLKKDYDAEAFNNAIASNDKKVIFAVAVKTKLDEQDVRSTRSVVSEFDLDMDTQNGVRAKDFTVNGTDIYKLKNRWRLSEANVPTAGVEDLTWAVPTEKIPTPAVKAVTTGEGKNVVEKKNHLLASPYYNGDALVADCRQSMECLAVEVGMPITISYNYNSDDESRFYNKNQKVAGFYVTLDETHAVESGVSEINAWHSYKYTGLNTMLGVDENGNPTNTGVITIENLNNVKGDIIGFRVYAVNLDGTLLDPDGRAFYVAVGDVATDGDIAAGETIEINSVSGKSAIFALGTDVSVGGNADAWVSSDDNPKFGGTDENGNSTSPTFKVNYFEDAAGKKPCSRDKAKFAQFVMTNPALYVDGATYTQTMLLYDYADDKITKLPVKTVTATMTKVMPTDVPTYAFRPGQQLDASNNATIEQDYITGKFRAYLKPEFGYEVTRKSSNGTVSMSNILYDQLASPFNFGNLKFNFVKASADKKNDITVEGSTTIDIAAGRIDNQTEIPVEVSYLYRSLSTKWNADKGRWDVGVDYPVAASQNLTAIFACWHHASTFEWGTHKDNNVNVSNKPVLKWQRGGSDDIVPSTIAAIKHTNSYDNTYFGDNLAITVMQKNYLAIKENSAKLTVNGQVNPYFAPTVTNEGDIVFKQVNQDENAPQKDHDEILSFDLTDAYGHTVTISLPVTIKSPALNN